jgi:hypothetical protein
MSDPPGWSSVRWSPRKDGSTKYTLGRLPVAASTKNWVIGRILAKWRGPYIAMNGRSEK